MRRPVLAATAAAAALLAAAPAQAQDDAQLWLQVNANVPLAERLRLTLEQIARFGDREDGLYQTEYGGVLGYRVTRTVELGFGYRYVGFHNGNTARDENRFRQQVVATFGPVVTRLRVDERLHPSGGEIGFRVRPLVRYNRPLGRGIGLFVSHESFFLPNSTGWGQRRGYERMRNMAGLTLPLSSSVSADLGYLNQYRFARKGAPARIDHALSLQLTINLAQLHHRPHADD